MPLEHSSSPGAFKRNVKALMGEVGKSPHVQSQKQALAIAFATQRRGHADGGVAGPASGVTGLAGGGPPPADYAPWFERQEARNMHTGPVLSAVAGRTDHIASSVPSGSFVLPADHVSALGQGNTLHGMSVVNRMFSSGGPYSMGPTMKSGRGMGAPKPPPLPKFGLGGGADEGGARGDEVGHPVEVMIAGGEHILSPEQVMAVGHKIAMDLGMKNVSQKQLLKMGHGALDRWIVATRKKHISTLKNLPPPAKK